MPSGQAQPGDYVRVDGLVLEVLEVIGANELIAALSERDMTLNTPRFSLHSTAATCALYGQTSGRDTQRIRREREKRKKFQKVYQENLSCSTPSSTK